MKKRDKQGINIVPEPRYWLEPFNYRSFYDIKACIIGDAPDPRTGVNDGLAFSYQPHVERVCETSDIIQNEYEKSVSTNRPHSFCLKPWAQNGVLLMYRYPTCEEGDRYAHEDIGWHWLCTEVVGTFGNFRPEVPMVFIGSAVKSYPRFVPNPSIALERPESARPLGPASLRQSGFIDWIDSNLPKGTVIDWKLP